jgi:RimJ/RimL family protein N-acetyltransferase
VAAPERRDDGGTVLRRWTVEDAPAVAHALRDNLAYLSAWMPWAKPEIADEDFQRERMAAAATRYSDDTADWEFAICTAAGALVGACGILERGGNPRVWYWVARAQAGNGHATRAARMLTGIWQDCRAERRLEIWCDEANLASVAIPARLGYRLDRVVEVEPETHTETGRMMVWVLDR